MLETIFDALASPAISMNEEVASALALAHTRMVFAKLASRVATVDRWFLPVLEEWQKERWDLAALWEPSYSQLELELQNQTEISRQSLIAAALTMHANGTKGNWSIKTTDPEHYRIARWCIPSCRSLEVSTAGDGYVNLLCDDQFISIPISSSEDGDLPRIRTGNFDALIDEQSPSAKLSISDGGEQKGKDKWTVDVWRDAYALLEEFTPEYAEWAARLIRVIVPVDAAIGYQVSASHWHRRGEVLMSWRLRPEQVAEMLVHEASHQHFFLASFIGSCDNGSDKSTYYSPVVKDQRPLSKILLAYHAFANVLLFFRRCRNRLDSKGLLFIDKESNKVMEELEQLEAPLRQSNALTRLGRHLWEPLANQIHEKHFHQVI